MNSPYRLGALTSEHRARVADIVRAAAVFSDDEVGVALDVFDDGLRGEYELLGLFGARAEVQFRRVARDDRGEARDDGEGASLVGYAAFGLTPGTDRAFDLYWIAVDPAAQGAGAGTVLLEGAEAAMRDRDARLVVAETSSRSAYAGTRRFYARRGYAEVARMREFYAPADDRVIFTKRLATPVSGHGVAE